MACFIVSPWKGMYFGSGTSATFLPNSRRVFFFGVAVKAKQLPFLSCRRDSMTALSLSSVSGASPSTSSPVSAFACAFFAAGSPSATCIAVEAFPP